MGMDRGLLLLFGHALPLAINGTAGLIGGVVAGGAVLKLFERTSCEDRL